MTREEIIEQLENAIELIKQNGKDWLDDRDIPILEVCIKSLTALDEIRAEIDAHRKTIKDMADTDDWFAGKISGHDCDIEIIDKYKAESEDKG